MTPEWWILAGLTLLLAGASFELIRGSLEQ